MKAVSITLNKVVFMLIAESGPKLVPIYLTLAVLPFTLMCV